MKKQNLETTESKTFDVFTIVKKNDKARICLGNVIISKEEFASIEAAEKYIKSKPYELIFNAACYVFEINQQLKSQKK